MHFQPPPRWSEVPSWPSQAAVASRPVLGERRDCTYPHNLICCAHKHKSEGHKCLRVGMPTRERKAHLASPAVAADRKSADHGVTSKEGPRRHFRSQKMGAAGPHPPHPPAPTAYLPCHSGVRLPKNAEIPSLASSVWKTRANAAFSASMPSSISPLAEVCLISAIATGACPASFRA